MVNHRDGFLSSLREFPPNAQRGQRSAACGALISALPQRLLLFVPR
jgi:hypothetical protein